jgi:hypothetical protein
MRMVASFFLLREIRSVEAIVAALSSSQVKYVVVGGLAVIAYGYERLTKDVDLVIGLEPDNFVVGLRWGYLAALGYCARTHLCSDNVS